jgi:hypothetical protein
MTGPKVTIIQRTEAVTSPSGATPVLVDALQLMSTTKTTVFDRLIPADFYCVTLDPNDTSTGTMTINFNGAGTGGTFTSTLDIWIDIHYGSLTGAVVNPGGTELTSCWNWLG